ncbi:peptidyl-tRNA hydrolase [Fulvimarina pelagi HTCC2506]|uniref:Peptidyl-tRNA hydrolase n=2 Tax=Fulvimarina pelagi TaxID=217511 RepID=Q0G096_9HYPH|nr:aminoacyl-tRNA hydrolase [Fulvimarina pelagi]EAU40697.1 peptidyl-tRNA hydrolase [Fulvimarina pelagi HTCC2506]BAT31240.1 peptidyl-tRNA hydrolase [Fulvimarina pelagi]
MILIAGLGNPGPKYAGNRHNIGFMAVDEIARDPAFSPWSKKFSGEISEGQVGGEKVLLLKPLTFMNDSGRSVGEAARFFKIEPKDVIVVHDELDLDPGRVKVKTGGGNGGHNGLRSTDAHLGTKDYRRMRLGIGHPGRKEAVTPHVLGDFSKADREWLQPLLTTIARNLEPLVRGEDASFMNKVSVAGGSSASASSKPNDPAKPAKGKSHIHQARGTGPQVKLPDKGPMAEMLKRMFGKGE